MKTPMQKLIEYIEDWQPKNKSTNGIWQKAKSLIEEEKEIIIDAYLVSHPEGVPDFEGENYYNENFT